MSEEIIEGEQGLKPVELGFHVLAIDFFFPGCRRLCKMHSIAFRLLRLPVLGVPLRTESFRECGKSSSK